MHLHEIEFGVTSTEKSKAFYEMLGLQLNVDQANLKVFNAAVENVDFNVSKHFPPRKYLYQLFYRRSRGNRDQVKRKSYFYRRAETFSFGYDVH